MTIKPKETLAAVGYYMIGISKLPGYVGFIDFIFQTVVCRRYTGFL
jgi:hypothetical protein